MSEISFGITEKKFLVDTYVSGVSGLLYYGDSILTDDYYIKNVHVWDGQKYVNKGEHSIFVLGDVNPGDYLTTTTIKGVAQVTMLPKVAFAQAVSGRAPEPHKKYSVIGRVHVKLL